MDTYLPPPDGSDNSTIQLTQVLDKLNSKIDLFNYNIDRFVIAQQTVAAASAPPPPFPKIPVKFLVFFAVVGYFLLFSKFNHRAAVVVKV